MQLARAPFGELQKVYPRAKKLGQLSIQYVKKGLCAFPFIALLLNALDTFKGAVPLASKLLFMLVC